MTLTLPVQLDPASAPDYTLHITASGQSVRVYATDNGPERFIHGAVFENDAWRLMAWHANGKFLNDETSSYDLRDRPKAKRGWWVASWQTADGEGICSTAHETPEVAHNVEAYPFPRLRALTYVEEGDGLDDIDSAPPPLRVDWPNLPEWAKWAAANPSGLVCQYESRPEARRDVWATAYRWRALKPYLYRLAPDFDWRETLIQRPEGV